MNWIIKKTNKMTYHTDLSVVFKPLSDNIQNYNWLVSDVEFMSDEPLPINMAEDFFILDAPAFKKLVISNAQIIWGVIVGVPVDIIIDIDTKNLPFADGNPLIWENGNLQYPGAEIEIICFDSGYTIAKFTKEELSNKFSAFFDEALDLQKLKK